MSLSRGSSVNRPALILLALTALLSTSCESTDSVGPGVPPPVAESPVGALRLLEWSWDNEEFAKLPGLFPADYHFRLSYADSAGHPPHSNWGRSDELASSGKCFREARVLSFQLDETLEVIDDDRPGKDPRWHKVIQTQAWVQAEVRTDLGPVRLEAEGPAKFYFVRGDSAKIPLGYYPPYTPDSTVWWIDRWEDRTLPAGVASAHPTSPMTWGAFKLFFR